LPARLLPEFETLHSAFCYQSFFNIAVFDSARRKHFCFNEFHRWHIYIYRS